MFKTNNYAFRLIEKENKRLLRENERLRKQIDEIDILKKEYKKLIEDLNSSKKQYSELYNNLNVTKLKMDYELKNLIK